MGTLSAADAKWLEQRMQEDKALAAEVGELRQIAETERYLNDAMPEPERKAFETRLQEQPGLRQKIDKQRLAMQKIQQYKKRQTADVVEEIAEKNRNAPGNNRRLWWGALGVVIVAVGIWVLLPDPDTSLSDTPSSTNATETPKADQPPASPPAQREPAPSEPVTPAEPSAEPSTANADPGPIAMLVDEYSKEIHPFDESRGNPDFTAWKALYDQGEYRQLIELVEPVVDEVSANDPELRLALGLAYFYEAQYEAAIPHFEKLEGTTQQSSARWYRILALLQLEKINDARPLLQDVLDARASSRKAKAQKLMTLIE